MIKLTRLGLINFPNFPLGSLPVLIHDIGIYSNNARLHISRTHFIFNKSNRTSAIRLDDSRIIRKVLFKCICVFHRQFHIRQIAGDTSFNSLIIFHRNFLRSLIIRRFKALFFRITAIRFQCISPHRNNSIFRKLAKFIPRSFNDISIHQSNRKVSNIRY